MRSFSRLGRNMLGAGLLAAAAGCNGGAASGGASIEPPERYLGALAHAAPAPTGIGNVAFSVGFTPPDQPAKGIAPKYIAPTTRSLAILSDGRNAVVVNLTPTSPNCSPNPAQPGSYICTAALHVAAGNHVFTVTAYDQTGGVGNVLSTNSTGTIYVPATGSTRISLVLAGTARYVVLSLAITNPPVGKAATIALTAMVEDADRNIIIGSAPYEYPVTLTTSDSLDGPLSKTILHSPVDAANVTANYTGGKIASIRYSASAQGVPPVNVTAVDLQPGASPAGHVFVTNLGAATVSEFNLAQPGAAPTTISGGGLTSPWGIAVAANDMLYVTNYNDDSVSVFNLADGNIPRPVITGGLDHPTFAAADAGGLLSISSYYAHRIETFDTAHGNAMLPFGPLFSAVGGVAIDTSGKLYVANDDNGVDEVNIYDPADGYAELPPITGGGLNGPAGLALDAGGKLYVVNRSSNSVSVFDTAHGNAVLPAIVGGEMSFPEGVAIDASGKLYVATPVGAARPYTGVISVFDTMHGNAALQPIVSGISVPYGVAVH